MANLVKDVASPEFQEWLNDLSSQKWYSIFDASLRTGIPIPVIQDCVDNKRDGFPFPDVRSRFGWFWFEKTLVSWMEANTAAFYANR